MEVFKDIPNYEGLYQVSNLGNVKSLVKGIILKPYKSKKYYSVSLSLNGVYKTKNIHQLVAYAFLSYSNKPFGYVVDHIDNNPYNNRLENLQVISQRENLSKDRVSKSGYTGVHWNNTAKKWSSRINVNGKKKFLGYFNESKEASKVYQRELSLINKRN